MLEALLATEAYDFILIRFNALTKIFDDMGIKQIPDIEGGRGRRS